MEQGTYVKLLEIPDGHRFFDVKSEEEIATMNEQLAGQMAFTGKIDKEGDSHISTEDGCSTWWPTDRMEPGDRPPPVVEMQPIDVNSMKSVADGLMSLVARIEFLGSPVRVAVVVEDLRDQGNVQVLGGRRARDMAKRSFDKHSDQDGGLGALLGMMAGRHR